MLNENEMLNLCVFATGCSVHPQHLTDQCQCTGAGTEGARPPSAAAPGHAGLLGESWSHCELTPSADVVHRSCLSNTKDGVNCAVFCLFRVLCSYLMCLFCVSKVEELDHLNIIHVTGTKGKVRRQKLLMFAVGLIH